MIRGSGVQVDRELAAALDAVPDPAGPPGRWTKKDALGWSTAKQGTIPSGCGKQLGSPEIRGGAGRRLTVGAAQDGAGAADWALPDPGPYPPCGNHMQYPTDARSVHR